MTINLGQNLILRAQDVCKDFRRESGEVVRALDHVSLEAPPGKLTALVGPDGAGKTTLLRLAAGLLTADAGELTVVGVNVAGDPQQVQSRIGYMPQRFGLYEDLSVQENLDLYADLHGVTRAERRERYPRLMSMTALGPFTKRLAGRLSGGMKQKLGLACTLVRTPELLLLDEPTVGIDPLSRRELWDIILQLVNELGMTVVMSTSYLEEAERCDYAVIMHQGRVLAEGPPSQVSTLASGRTFVANPPSGHTARGFQARLLDDPSVLDAVPEGGQVRFVLASTSRAKEGAPRQSAESRHAERSEARPARRGEEQSEILRFTQDDRTGLCPTGTPIPLPAAPAGALAVEPRFEDGFMALLRQMGTQRQASHSMQLDHRPRPAGGEAVVEVTDLVKKFGHFIAVDHVTFDVRRGEVFGLLGPNGAGKTTTFRMLCGLSPATKGTLRVAGVDLRRARASARQEIGYVAQKFSLYGQLSVTENLEFFASAYGLRGRLKQQRIDWALDQFELVSLARLPSGQLPGGYKQRLAMAAAMLHEPEILFLDEPTSGADPLARREFWRRITALAEQGVTIIVTTHFMEEAEYCDRIVILEAGKVLLQGTPAEVREMAEPVPGRKPRMEDAFITVVQQARAEAASQKTIGGFA